MSFAVVVHPRTLTLLGSISMIIYSIYKFVNRINGKVYIGYTKNVHKRLSEHKQQSVSGQNKLYKAIRKYGWDAFEFYVIYQSKDSNHCLNEMEPHFIKECDSFRHGYNSTPGGQKGSYDPSAESKVKMSQSRKRRFIAKDSDGNTYTIDNTDTRFLSGELVGINKDTKASDISRQRQSKSRLGNKIRLGIPHTEETKRLISERTSLALRGVKKNRITCPHCAKEGGAGNMKRYHFDFCKMIR